MWHITDDGVLVVTDGNITELVCCNDKVKQVRFEAHTPKLAHVDLEFTRVTNLQPFAHLPNLKTMRACIHADSTPLAHKKMAFFQGDLSFILGDDDLSGIDY